MKNANILLLRLLIAVFCGCVVTGLALRAGWKGASGGGVLTSSQHETQHTLIAINQVISDYRAKHHRLPASLIQLTSSLKDKHVYLPNDKNIVDGWKVPFQYTVQGDHYLVTSYGEDKKSGGTAFNADLTSDNPYPPEAALTFAWFLSEPSTHEMVLAAYVSGIFTMILCLVTIRFSTLSPRDIPKLILAVLVLLVGASFMGTLITILHYPSGH